MRVLLILGTALEILLLVVVLAVYLVAIARRLRTIATYLGKVTFGVRAIESQCAPIGPAVTKINAQLTTIAGALAGVADLAERRAGGDGRVDPAPAPAPGGGGG